ncbi:MAG: SCO family protein [Pseudohongiellaceae bacterium]|nr:SCO family protein [Pseudohongiellaceae bacterium]
MNRNIKITVISCFLFVALVFVLTYFRITGNNDVSMSPEQLRELGALVYDEPVNLQPFSLLDHNGQRFSNDSLRGQWSLIFFGFTNCPDICPLTLTELRQFYLALGDGPMAEDTRVIMVSVDPIRDTTEALAQYMENFHETFLGVNGEYSDIEAFARQLYIAHTPPPVSSDDHSGHDMGEMENYDIDHSGNVLIINPEGQYIGFFDAAIQDAELTRAYPAIRALF